MGAFASPGPAAEPPYPRVYRTFMPDSGPSAFAVELAPGLALCYDPLRGGVNAAWRGSIDLAPTLKAKINSPAAMMGEVFYAEKARQPLRTAPDAAREPARRFQGYRYEKNAVTFLYSVDGVVVTERLSVSPEGGILREFRQPEGQALYFLAEEQPAAIVGWKDAAAIKPGIRHAAGGVFRQILTPKSPASR
jgi:hypothetical protein